ncbi:MAG: hypothetical protein NC115_08490 [Bacteroidales bacterium]|nr:hypothetical protein [Bacteroidales bacterium]
MKRQILTILAVLACCCCAPKGGQWTKEEANAWYDSQEWPVGCNYVPSYAINQYEFWQEETFNPEIIDKELSVAESIGFNAVRIYLHEGLWYADRYGFKKRIEQFLGIADSHGIKCIVTFFTNGGNHDKEFTLGPQPEAIPGTHNSNWIPSPGKKVIDNPDEWPRLKEYVQDILRTFSDDGRILYWCLCNEPENMKGGCDVAEFMPEVYRWAWEVRPGQPLTSPVWQRPGKGGTQTKLDLVAFVCTNSDIITFHCYSKPVEVENYIAMLSRFGRPMICQEYLARNYGNTFETVMPILKNARVGAINWGLVNNKCHFHYPWGHKAGDPEPEIWFHDIFRSDYTPYDEAEIDFIKSMTAEK